MEHIGRAYNFSLITLRSLVIAAQVVLLERMYCPNAFLMVWLCLCLTTCKACIFSFQVITTLWINQASVRLLNILLFPQTSDSNHWNTRKMQEHIIPELSSEFDSEADDSLSEPELLSAASCSSCFCSISFLDTFLRWSLKSSLQIKYTLSLQYVTSMVYRKVLWYKCLELSVQILWIFMAASYRDLI